MKNPIIIRHSESTPNGIRIISSIKPKIACETYFSSTGEIESRIFNFEHATYDYLDGFVKKLFKIRTTFNIIIIILVAITLNPWYMLAACYFAFLGSRNFFVLLLLTLASQKKNSDFYYQALLHGAEHMATNAYNQLGRLPTSIEEIKKFSIISKKCGSRYIFAETLDILFSSLAIVLFANKNVFFTFILVILIIVFFKLSAKYGFLSFLQILVLKKPTDKELTLALEAIKYFEKVEQYLGENKDKISTIDVYIEKNNL